MRSIPPVPDPLVAHDPHCGIQLSKVLFSSTGLSPAWDIWVVNAGTRVSPNSLKKDSSLIGVVWHWGGDSCPVFQAPGLCCGVEMTVDNEASEEKKPNRNRADTGTWSYPEAQLPSWVASKYYKASGMNFILYLYVCKVANGTLFGKAGCHPELLKCWHSLSVLAHSFPTVWH